MNDFSVLSAAAITAGLVFIYGAIKGIYPQDVIRGLMGKDPIHPPLGNVKSFGRQLPSSTTAPNPGVPIGSGVFIPGQPVVSV